MTLLTTEIDGIEHGIDFRQSSMPEWPLKHFEDPLALGIDLSTPKTIGTR
jgi:hypothetical protein